MDNFKRSKIPKAEPLCGTFPKNLAVMAKRTSVFGETAARMTEVFFIPRTRRA